MPPSVNAVEAFTYTAAASTSLTNRSMAAEPSAKLRVGDDGLGMHRAVAVDVGNGLLGAANAAHGQVGRKVFRFPILL